MKMNWIGVLILAGLAVELLLNTLADFLNLRSAGAEVPADFRDVYDPERYCKAQAYLAANTRLGWAVRGFDTLVLLLFWFGGGFGVLDGWVRGFGWGPIPTGLAFVGALAGLKLVLGLPFDLYATFGIEARFGFNRTSAAVFWADRVKGLGLALVLGGPLLAALLGFLIYAGDHAWWGCWLALSLFMLGLHLAAPAWILPLFNRFQPLPEGRLRQAILAYARGIRFPLDNILVMDGSRRSGKSNAFFTGLGRHKRIVLFDTLVKRHSVGEMVAILAHEMGHFKKRHMDQALVIAVVHAGVICYLLALVLSCPALYAAFFMETPSVHAGLVFFGILCGPLEFLAGLPLRALARQNELAADRFAVATTGNKEALESALKKLSAHNLANLSPHQFYVWLHYAHPPVTQRIAAIETIRDPRLFGWDPKTF
jgi:STE24 endopeptidase